MRQAHTNQLASKKMGKHTYTLKELAQRDFTSAPKVKDTGPKFNLVNIKEGLLENQEAQLLKGAPAETKSSPDQNQNQQTIPINDQSLTLPIKLVEQLITKEIAKTAAALE